MCSHVFAIGQRTKGKRERLEVRRLILSDRRGALNWRTMQTKEGKPARERGAKRLTRKEDGKCYGNSDECKQVYT